VVGSWSVDGHRYGPGQACGGAGEMLPVTVQLAAPLGNRVVLDITDGQPVTPEIAALAPMPR